MNELIELSIFLIIGGFIFWVIKFFIHIEKTTEVCIWCGRYNEIGAKKCIHCGAREGL